MIRMRSDPVPVMPAAESEEVGETIPEAGVRSVCRRILTSPFFRTSPRMRRLLDYLVEKALEHDAGAVSEYAIGIRVFDRHPTAYSTAEDPIVRVQVGRLRAKLKDYYATPGSGADIEITIPAGSYMPAFRRFEDRPRKTPQLPLLSVAPFKCASRDQSADAFAKGLYEELLHQLHSKDGNVIARTSARATPCEYRCASAGVGRGDADYALEGSVQADSGRIRVTVRLLAVATGGIVWSEQFDRRQDLSIALQEDLALSVCDALKLPE